MSEIFFKMQLSWTIYLYKDLFPLNLARCGGGAILAEKTSQGCGGGTI